MGKYHVKECVLFDYFEQLFSLHIYISFYCRILILFLKSALLDTILLSRKKMYIAPVKLLPVTYFSMPLFAKATCLVLSQKSCSIVAALSA